MFTSLANNLDARDSDGNADVFAKEVPTGELHLVSQDERDKAGGSDGAVSGDGRTIVFVRREGGSVEVRRLSAGEILKVASPVDGDEPLDAKDLTVSHDGTISRKNDRVAFRAGTDVLVVEK